MRLVKHENEEKPYAVETDSGSVIRAFYHRWEAFSFMEHTRKLIHDEKS